jgi:anti-sigma regulatory factor (Ser/Thr protein kinase)
MYAGYNRGAVDVETHLAYGKQKNDAKRHLTQLGLEAGSKYDSNTISLGVKARYNIHHDQNKVWQISPYTDVNVNWYNQDRYKESGAGVYNQEADPFNNTYSTGEVGLEFARSLPKGSLAVNVGYKKVLSGSNPNMSVVYSGNPNGKLTISDTTEIKPYLLSPALDIAISKASDVAEVRQAIEALYLTINTHDLSRMSSFMTAVGEAITNAIKHAKGGRVVASSSDQALWVAVSDRGPGIESVILPGAVLRRGFSTKVSMGLGYSLMLDGADRILLHTGRRGTTVVLIQEMVNRQPDLAALPDTWESV